MKKRYILLGCLVLLAFLTLACVLDDPCRRLDGTDGCKVEEAVPSDPETYWSDEW
jgi:hypothetical protein